MGLRRLNMWERSLGDMVSERCKDPFIWGEWDCALFAAECILSMTGVDVAKGYRGTYSTSFGAIRVLKREVGGYVEELCEVVAKQYGADEIAPPYAQRGDICHIRWDEPGEKRPRETIGPVWLDGRQICVLGEQGLFFVPVNVAGRAWHVG